MKVDHYKDRVTSLAVMLAHELPSTSSPLPKVSNSTKIPPDVPATIADHDVNESKPRRVQALLDTDLHENDASDEEMKEIESPDFDLEYGTDNLNDNLDRLESENSSEVMEEANVENVENSQESKDKVVMLDHDYCGPPDAKKHKPNQGAFEIILKYSEPLKISNIKAIFDNQVCTFKGVFTCSILVIILVRYCDNTYKY